MFCIIYNFLLQALSALAVALAVAVTLSLALALVLVLALALFSRTSVIPSVVVRCACFGFWFYRFASCRVAEPVALINKLSGVLTSTSALPSTLQLFVMLC